MRRLNIAKLPAAVNGRVHNPMKRLLWTLVMVLCAYAPSASAQYSHPSEAGYYACQNPGETPDQFYGRWPGWLLEAVAATPDSPMQYRYRETSQGRVLIAIGGIEADESSRLRSALISNGRIDEVWLISPGGVSMEGIRMADVLRDAGVVTRVPGGGACISACTSAFLGGAMRFVDPGGAYGVHMFSARNSVVANTRGTTPDVGRLTVQTEERSAQHAVDYSQMLLRMGVSLRWADVTFHTPNRCVRYLSRSVMHDLNVINAD